MSTRCAGMRAKRELKSSIHPMIIYIHTDRRKCSARRRTVSAVREAELYTRYTKSSRFVYHVSLFVYFNTRICIKKGLAKYTGTRKYIKKGYSKIQDTRNIKLLV